VLDFEDELKQLRVEYLQDAWERLRDLEHLLAALDRDPHDREGLEQALRRFHGFAGSGRTHGFPRVTELGEEGECRCRAWIATGAAPDEEERRALHALGDLIAGALGPRPTTTRILCAENDGTEAAFLRTVLESAGYEVRRCAAPRDLAAEVARFPPDLIVADDPFHRWRWLRKDERYAAVPMLFLTTEHEIATRLGADPRETDDFLAKPASPGALLTAVGNRLARAQPRT
jgi:CheY-like chemotaxis protein